MLPKISYLNFLMLFMASKINIFIRRTEYSLTLIIIIALKKSKKKIIRNKKLNERD
jgi:hypothetical protein